MKIDVERRLFSEAFGDAAAVAPRTSPKPIIMSVKVRATDDGCVLEATDLDVGIRRHVHGVEVLRAGSAILPRDRVAAILAKSPDPRLTIDHDGPTLRIDGDADAFTMATEDAGLFPSLPDPDAAAGTVTVAAADLRRLIRRTSYACDQNSQRYALGGCLVETAGPAVAFIGTDGRRLARMECPATITGDVGRPVIPGKMMRLIDRVIADDDAPVTVAFTPNAVFVRTERAELFGRLVEGRFPNYRAAIPADDAPARFPAVAGAMASAVDRAKVMVDVASMALHVALSPGCLTITAAASDGKGRVRVPVDHDGPDAGAAYDAEYLLDCLKSLPPDAPIIVELGDKLRAMIVRTDGYLYILQSVVLG